MSYLYSSLANNIIESIDHGVYQTGARLPGIRQTSQNEGVSPATVVAAYRHLELQGYIEARPRSGFYVCKRLNIRLEEPKTSKPPKQPKLVSGQALVLQLAQDGHDDQLVNFGAAIPHPSLLPTHAISQTLSSVAKEHRNHLNNYAFPPGSPELRKEIAKRLALTGCLTSHENIVITNGCQEALFLSLKTVTKPGDIVAIESPVYHGLLQVIDALGLKALEIPTHPREGLSLKDLQQALEQWPIKACVVIPNFSNPLGCSMTDEHKKGLIKLINRYSGITLIEDDINGDLSFDGKRPSVVKRFETKGNVIYCSSVSKTLSPGLRVGWIVSEKYQTELQYQKYVTNSATSTINQMVVAHLFASGRYDRHLRKMRISLAQTVNRMMVSINKYFPRKTKITRPHGGYVLWIELSNVINTDTLREKALKKGISIAPGSMFSPTGKYRNCMRMSCVSPWSDKIESAIRKLGRLIDAEAEK